MIVDNIENISMYETVVPGISEAFQQIQRIETLEDRRYFYIMFPHDGHKAVSHLEEQYKYRKIVLKLQNAYHQCS